MTSLDRAIEIRDQALKAVADRITELGPDYHPACIPIVAANVAMASMADQLLDDLQVPAALVVGHMKRLCDPAAAAAGELSWPFQVGARVRYAGESDGVCGTVERVYDGTNGSGLVGEVLVAWDTGGAFIEQAAALTFGTHYRERGEL